MVTHCQASIVIGALATRPILQQQHKTQLEELIDEYTKSAVLLENLSKAADVPALLEREALVCAGLGLIGHDNLEKMQLKEGFNQVKCTYLKAVLPRLNTVCDEVEEEIYEYEKSGAEEPDNETALRLFGAAADGKHT